MRYRMKQAKGLTIVQLMVILLIVGIVLMVVVDIVIAKRCEADPSRAVCIKKSS